jgi:hypothetical protein
MKVPEHMLLLEPLGCTAEGIMQQGARYPAAVQRYIDCLERGWLGQALVERYTYGESPGTPAGMLQTNSIQDGRLVEWLKPIEDEIKDDLRGLLRGGYDEMLVTERDVYARATEDIEDPGRELLRQLVDMIDQGLQVAQPDALENNRLADSYTGYAQDMRDYHECSRASSCAVNRAQVVLWTGRCNHPTK